MHILNNVLHIFWEMSNFFWINVQLFLDQCPTFFWDDVQLFLGNVQLFSAFTVFEIYVKSYVNLPNLN